MKIAQVLLIFVLFVGARGWSQEILTNDSVLKMVKAGLAESVIVTMIQQQPGNYSLKVDDLIALKQAGVSEKVMGAMAARATAGTGSGASAPPVQPGQAVPVAPGVVVAYPGGGTPSGATPGSGVGAGDPNDPMAPHDSGIWVMMEGRDGKKEMVILERAAYQGAKTGGMFTSALTYGIKKMKIRAVIPGAKANIRVGDSNPTFYFYFEDKAAGLGKGMFGSGSVSNPNQFALVKLEEKDKNRQTIIGEAGAFGASSGTHEKSMIQFKSERIRAGLYRVRPLTPMADGEYCFLASTPIVGATGAGASTAIDLYDFAISTR